METQKEHDVIVIGAVLQAVGQQKRFAKKHWGWSVGEWHHFNDRKVGLLKEKKEEVILLYDFKIPNYYHPSNFNLT